MTWSVSAVSRRTRQKGRHQTKLTGMVVPKKGDMLCGTPTTPTLLQFKLTRGFAIVALILPFVELPEVDCLLFVFLFVHLIYVKWNQRHPYYQIN